jgi:drug/metabolite transporter superfamily protein YnfA
VIQSSPAIEEERVNESGHTGPLGQPRGIGFGILLYIVTLSLYGWYWAFKTHEEIKQRSGEGVGGVLGLVIWIVAGFVSAFLIPSEIGKMYAKDGQEPPLNGWTGLWLIPGGLLIIPAIIWFVKVQTALNNYWTARGAIAA